ncbi:MAG: DUF2807 domain-containing protein [Elainellaceae cyanobacterium]
MRSKRLGLGVGLTALSLLIGCTLSLGSMRGSGIIKTEARDVSDFSSLSSQSVGKVMVQQTDQESLTITADDNILPLLESDVDNHVLYLGIVDDASFNPTQPIEYVVEVQHLDSLTIGGVGSADIKDIQGETLSIVLDGVGSVTIAGNVDVLELTVSGVGSFNGEALITQQATVHSSGVGHVVVNVSEQLNATASGVGSVEYIGSPHVQESVEGGGSIRQR